MSIEKIGKAIHERIAFHQNLRGELVKTGDVAGFDRECAIIDGLFEAVQIVVDAIGTDVQINQNTEL